MPAGQALARGATRFLARPATVWELAVLGGLVSAGVLVLTTAGGALYLADQGSEGMPLLYLALAGVSMPLASALSASLARWRPVAVFRGLCAVSAVAALAAFGVEGRPALAFAVYLAAYLLEILVDTLYWIIAAEYLPTRELKRHTPFLAMSFGGGGAVGGVLAALLTGHFPTAALLPLVAALFAAAAFQLVRIERCLPAVGDGEEDEEEAGPVAALRAVARAMRGFPLVLVVCGSVLLMSGMFCLQDYLAMAAYAEAYPDSAELAGFLAVVYSAQQAAELLLLAVLSPLVLDRFGPLARNLVFPLTSLAALAALGLWWGLPAAILLHVNANAVSNAVFEPVKTLNYAAIPHRVCGQVRVLVEGIAYPAGIALSGAGLLALQAAGAGPREVLPIALALGVLFLAASAAVGAGFLPSLVRSLRQRDDGPAPLKSLARMDLQALRAHPDPAVREVGEQLARRFETATVPDGDAAEAGHTPEWVSDAAALAEDEDLDVRATAVEVLAAAARDWPAAVAALGDRLEDPAATVRHRAADALGGCGNKGAAVAARRLTSARGEVVNAAIRALGAIGTARARRSLRAHLHPLYQQARLNLARQAQAESVAQGGGGDARAGLLAAALADGNRRIVWQVLTVKAALGNRRDVNLLYNLARSADPRTRSDAVEALSSLPTGKLLRPVLDLLDTPAEGRPATGADAAPALPGSLPDGVLAAALGSLALATRLGPPLARAEDGELRRRLEQVLFLKSVAFFRSLSFEEIAALAERGELVTPMAGQVLAEEGEAVRHLFVVLEGSVRLVARGATLATLGAGETVGETAYDPAARHGASLLAGRGTRLLRFGQAAIADLVAEQPQVLRDVCLSLEDRLGRALARAMPEPVPPRGVDSPCKAA